MRSRKNTRDELEANLTEARKVEQSAFEHPFQGPCRNEFIFAFSTFLPSVRLASSSSRYFFLDLIDFLYSETSLFN